MSGRKGMKQYTEEMKKRVQEEIRSASSQYEVSRKYGISQYSIQRWCGLRPETKLRQLAPLPHRRKKQVQSIEDYKKENARLRTENELLQDFLQFAGRGCGPG